MLKIVKILGLLEGISFLLLLGVAMPLKYVMGIPSATIGIGYAHGFLFVLFYISLIAMQFKYSISWRLVLMGFIAALLPLGPFFYHPYFKKQWDTRNKKDPR